MSEEIAGSVTAVDQPQRRTRYHRPIRIVQAED